MWFTTIRAPAASVSPTADRSRPCTGSRRPARVSTACDPWRSGGAPRERNESATSDPIKPDRLTSTYKPAAIESGDWRQFSLLTLACTTLAGCMRRREPENGTSYLRVRSSTTRSRRPRCTTRSAAAGVSTISDSLTILFGSERVNASDGLFSNTTAYRRARHRQGIFDHSCAVTVTDETPEYDHQDEPQNRQTPRRLDSRRDSRESPV